MTPSRQNSIKYFDFNIPAMAATYKQPKIECEVKKYGIEDG